MSARLYHSIYASSAAMWQTVNDVFLIGLAVVGLVIVFAILIEKCLPEPQVNEDCFVRVEPHYHHSDGTVNVYPESTYLVGDCAESGECD